MNTFFRSHQHLPGKAWGCRTFTEHLPGKHTGLWPRTPGLRAREGYVFTICYAAAVLAQDETKVCFVNESSTIAEQFATLIHSCFTFVPRCFDDTTDTYINICIHIYYVFLFLFDMCGYWSIIQFVFFSSCVDTGVCVKNAHVARTCKSNPLPPNTMLTCTSPGLSASGCIIVAHSMSEGLGTYRVNFVWGGRGSPKSQMWFAGWAFLTQTPD